MKKFLSLVLALLMVLSVSVIAAPEVTTTQVTTSETETDVVPCDDLATVAEESDYGTLIADLDFTHDGEVKLTTSRNTVPASNFGTVNTQYLPNLWLSSHKDNDTFIIKDGVVNVSANYQWSRLWLYTGTKNPFKFGVYTLVYTISDTTPSTANYTSLTSSINASGTNGSDNMASSIKNINGQKQSFKGTTATYVDEIVVGKQELQAIQIMQTKGASDGTVNYTIDNVKLYYKMPAKITFAGEGLLPSESGAVHGIETDISSYKAVPYDENKTFVGWSLTPDGELLGNKITINEDTTLYAVYKDGYETVDADNGILAYFIDFDVTGDPVYENRDELLEVSNYTTQKVTPPASMPVVKLESYGANYAVNGEELVMVKSNYPRWWLTAFNEDGTEGSFPKGTYTVEYMVKADQANAVPNNVAVFGVLSVWNNPNWVTKTADFGKMPSDDYGYYKTYFTYDGNVVKNSSGSEVVADNSDGKMKDFSAGLHRIGFYSGGGSTYNGVARRYNWVKVWYHPDTVNVTFDANGKDVDDLPAAQTVSYKDYPIGSAAKLSNCGTSRFVGWSTSPDGDLITDAKMNLFADTTFYAVWDDNYYATADEEAAGELLIHVHYNNSGAANLTSNLVNYSTIGSAFGAMFEGYTGDQKGWLQGASNANRIFTTKYGTPESHKHPDNEFWITSVKQGANYPKLNIGCAGGHLANGIYTLYAEVSAHDMENIKYISYNGYTTADLNPSTGKETDVTTDESNIVLDGSKQYIKKTMFVKDGYFGDYETGKLTYIRDDSTTSKIGFNFNIVPIDSTVEAKVSIHCDNFKIYYREYDFAPKSYNKNAIRVGAPTGIRFMASVGEVERAEENLTEYGFIVALKSTLDAAGVAPENFTMDSDVKYVKGLSYGEDDGKKLDRIFDTKNSFTYFTAVVYNIPADRYNENLVVVPYVIIDGNTVYGNAMVNNILDVAKALKETEFYEENKDAIDKIIAGEEL